MFNAADLQLTEAFKTKDHKKFKDALVRGAERSLHKDRKMSIFEESLSTPGCNRFIDSCFEMGYKSSYVNNEINKAAVHYVADSVDPQNLEAFLAQEVQQVNIDHQYLGDTALNMLCKNLNASNVIKSTECIVRLLQYDASPNIPDHAGKTPFYYVRNNLKISPEIRIELVIEFLRIAVLSEQEYRKGLNILLANKLDGGDNRLYSVLSRQFVSLDDDQTGQTLEKYEKSISGWNRGEFQKALLLEFFKNKRENSFKFVLAVMKSNSEFQNLSVIKEALNASCAWSDLLALLKSNHLTFKKSNKLIIFKLMLVYCGINDDISMDYEKCLEFLLIGNTEFINDLMFYAVEHRNNVAIRLLLCKGANLNKDNLGIIGKDVLESHFDSCVRKYFMNSIAHDNRFEVHLSIWNLLNSNNMLEISTFTEMAAIKELRPLLTHPLIDSLLQIIWKRLRIMYFAHLIIFTILCISLVTQILLRSDKKHTDHSATFWITKVICWVMAAFMALNKLLTVIRLAMQKNRNIYKFNFGMVTLQLLENLFLNMDSWRTLMFIFTCLEYGNQETQNTIAVITILLFVIRMNNLFGTLPIASVSKNMLMLREVAKTFIKCISQYSIFVFAFGLCFYVLFYKIDINVKDKNDEPVTVFHPIGAFIKTIIMFFGQYEDVNTEFNSFYACWILVLFMFVVMILTNLLGALAVSDIQTVQGQVDIRAALCRTKLLGSYEFALEGGWGNLKLLRRVTQALVGHHNQKYFLNKEILILPRQVNRLFVYGNFSTFKVDNSTVNQALQILENKNQFVEQKSVENIDKRFEAMSALLRNQLKEMSTLLERRFETLLDIRHK